MYICVICSWQVRFKSSRRFAIFKLFACFKMIPNNLNISYTYSLTSCAWNIFCGEHETFCTRIALVFACAGILCVCVYEFWWYDKMRCISLCVWCQSVWISFSYVFIYLSSHRFLVPLFALYDVKVRTENCAHTKYVRMYIFSMYKWGFYFWVLCSMLIHSAIVHTTSIYTIKMYCCCCCCSCVYLFCGSKRMSTI